MDIKDKLIFWKNECERATQYGFFFDTESMKAVLDTTEKQHEEIEQLHEELDKLRHLYSGAMKAVKGLTEENKRLKQNNARVISIGEVPKKPRIQPFNEIFETDFYRKKED